MNKKTRLFLIGSCKNFAIMTVFACGLLQAASIHAKQEYVIVAGYQLIKPATGLTGLNAGQAYQASGVLAEALVAMLAELNTSPGQIGDENRYLLEDMIKGFGVSLSPKGAELIPFVIYYCERAMRMNTPKHSMVWAVPEGSSAVMAFADHAKKKVTKLKGLPKYQGLSKGATDPLGLMAGGSYSGMTPQAVSGTERIAGYDARKHKYSFSVSAGGPIALINTRTTGHAWLSSDVDGFPIIAKFYQTFATATEDYKLMSGFGGGLGRSMADLTKKGVPMKTQQISFMETVKVGSTQTLSASQVVATAVRPLDTPMFRYIIGEEFPEGYEFIDPMKDIPKIPKDMPEKLSDMLEKMTPEQRKMMEQMGLDKFMPQQKR
ncbi:hypothetical protein ACFL17_00655 [Pseudomonadota bacterium]